MTHILFGRRAAFGAALALAAARAEAAETVTLTFLHVNDVYQHLGTASHGGLAELGTLVEAARAAAPGPSFLTFGGDLISPSLASSVTGGAHMVEIFNALGTDVAVLGNHEFDLGLPVIRQRIAESRFPWLGANVREADGRVFGGAVATVLREAAGLRIGFVGILTRATGDLAVGAGSLSFGPEQPALEAGIAALRRQGANIVVALTHQDLAEDERMAREVEGLDLVLGGHDHEPVLKRDTGAAVVKAGGDAEWLAVAELRVERPAGNRPARVRAIGLRLIPNVDVPPPRASRRWWRPWRRGCRRCWGSRWAGWRCRSIPAPPWSAPGRRRWAT
ncbi:bifunctional metallophosphatase/5'-nucleotidase [Paeniroseomonas aquatica]|uniref:bifunctional metallophosphatase/5'-nucleotidase n=1 Tax=Paeniroseomonas aquatica TaxID=373043 RepID=UPI003615DBB2